MLFLASMKGGILKKLEQIVQAAGYQLRYERGKFSSGSCILQDQRIILVNKFFNPEDRASILIELIIETGIESTLDKETNQWFQQQKLKRNPISD